MSNRGSSSRRGRRGGRGRRGYGPTGFEDQGGYMAAKISKLSNQFDRAAKSAFGEERPGIFRGVAIFVNGYTEPTAEELKRIMLANGGTFHHYYSRSKTTHIIATNLPDTKVKNMNTDRIVSPKWITDSLKVEYLLDYTNYLLYTNQSSKQPRIQFQRVSSSEESSRQFLRGSSDLLSANSSTSSVVSSVNASEETKPGEKSGERPSKVYQSDDEDLFSDWPEVTNSKNKPNSTVDMEVSDPSVGTSDALMDFSVPSVELTNPPDQGGNGLGTKSEGNMGNSLNRKETEVDFKMKIEENDLTRKKELATDSKIKGKTVSPSGREGQTITQNISPSKGHSMSTANPKFLSEFYNNSRLHHISTMGAMFKQYVTEMQTKGTEFPGRKALKDWVSNKRKESSPQSGNSLQSEAHITSKIGSKGKRTIMHVDMDCFFVSVGLRNHPELRGKPIAVTHSRGGGRTQAREGVDRNFELNFYKERAEKRLQSKIKSSNVNKPADSDSTIDFNEEDGDKGHQQTDARDPSSIAPKFSSLPLIDDTCSMSEIASCSYEARQAGVRNGMFMGPALKLCPDLKTIPYDFEGYKEVAYKLYDIVASFTHDIEAVSCDEMFVDLTELLSDCKVTPLEFASYLRQEVQNATRCPCSAGMGPNMLVARMATRRAKPNGQYMADPERLSEYMINEKVSDLPGVGWSLGKRLESQRIKTCGDLQVKSLGQLQALFGNKTGQSLYYYCRGIDDRPVRSEHVRKSVSAEVNYGIRFTSNADAARFISELSSEVESRLNAINLKGKCITLKLKVRAKDAPVETAKFMGHGVCDNIAKSVSLGSATSSSATIEREVMTLLRQIKVPPQDFRGVGIQVSRLEGHQGTPGSSGLTGNASIKSFMLSAKSKSERASAEHEVSSSDSKRGKKRDSSVFAITSLVNSENSSSRFKPSSSPQPSTSTGQPPTTMSESVPVMPKENSASSPKGTIDMEVLMALPEDMREQVIAEYCQQGYTVPESYGGPAAGGSGKPNDPQPSTSHSAGANEHGMSSALENSPALLREGLHLQEEKDSQQSVTSVRSDDSDSEALITSFSQVDSSFLAAIPSEMREELRLDFEHKKRLASGASTASSHLPRQHQSAVRGGLFQSGVKTSQRGQAVVANLRSGVLDGPNSRALPPPPIRTGKKRGRKPKSFGSSSRSPVKSTRKTPQAFPKKTSEKGFVDILSFPEIKASSQDSSVDDSLAASSSSNQMHDVESLLVKEAAREEVPQLCGAVELSEVKSFIREWVASCPNPEEEDVDIIANYYTSLITYRDLEKVDLLIKYLYRQVLHTHNQLWQLAYTNVVERVQVAMLDQYEVKMKVPPIVVEEK